MNRFLQFTQLESAIDKQADPTLQGPEVLRGRISMVAAVPSPCAFSPSILVHVVTALRPRMQGLNDECTPNQ